MNNGKDSLHFKENNLISKNNKHNKVNRTGRESTKWHSKIVPGKGRNSNKTTVTDNGSGIIDTTGGQIDMNKVGKVLNEILDNDLSKLDALAKINSYRNKKIIGEQEYNALLKEIEGAYN